MKPRSRRTRKSSESDALALLAKPSLLPTESAQEFEFVRKALVEVVGPCGFVEQMYVADIAANVWDTLRLRRSKSKMINVAFRDALRTLLHNLDEEPNSIIASKRSANLSFGWFGDSANKKEVDQILAWFNLDESAIEAEAIRRLAPQLEVLEKMLTSLELRRHRSLLAIAEYRKSFGAQVKEASDNILEAKPMEQLQTQLTSK